MDRLDRIVELARDAVWARLAAAGPGGPLCLAALYPGSMSPHPAQLNALTEGTRERMLRRGRPVDALASLWQWQGGWDLRDRTERAVEVVEDDEMDLARTLERAGCEDVEVAVLLELAYRMSRQPSPPVAVSDDFACLVVEIGEPDVTIERFVACARPEVVAAYRARGWLAGSVEARVPVRAGEYGLDRVAAGRLAELVEREMADVRRSVQRVAGQERIALIGFIWADPETATATYVYVSTEHERSAAIRDGVSDDALERLWALPSWEYDDILGREDEAMTYELAERVAADLRAVDCREPRRRFCTRSPIGSPATRVACESRWTSGASPSSTSASTRRRSPSAPAPFPRRLPPTSAAVGCATRGPSGRDRRRLGVTGVPTPEPGSATARMGAAGLEPATPTV